MTKLRRVTWTLACCSVLAQPSPSSAQQSYSFQNFGYLIDAPVFDADGNRLFGTNYVAMLYGGISLDALAPALDYWLGGRMAPVPFTVTRGGMTGYFSGGIAEVPNTACWGYVPWLQVRAWDARLGASYEEVVALGLGGYGESGLMRLVGGGRQPCTDPPLPPSILSGLQSFSLRPVQAVRVAIDLYPGLRISGQVGQSYRIEYVPQLQETNEWRFLTNVVLNAPELLWVDPEPARPSQKFYRVIPAP